MSQLGLHGILSQNKTKTQTKTLTKNIHAILHGNAKFTGNKLKLQSIRVMFWKTKQQNKTKLMYTLPIPQYFAYM